MASVCAWGPVLLAVFLSLTHKRAEGRAPVWSSGFTTNVAPKGGFSRIRF
jgi:hypothetical protein